MAGKRHTFVIVDENTLTSYGFRMLAKGGDIEQYNTNPLVLWMHRRPKKYADKNEEETEVFPIGLGYNLRLKNGQWLADIEFDQSDNFAKKIEEKVESGHIRMASPGIEPITWSNDPKLTLTGQKYETLVEWQLVEISIVDIGSNPKALKLYNSQRELIELSAGQENKYIPLLNDKPNSNKNMDFLQEIAVLLGKEPDAARESVLTALKERLTLAKEAEGYKTKLATLETEVQSSREAAIVSLVKSNVDKKFTADKEAHYIKLGKDTSIETLKGVIENLPEIKRVTDVLTLSKNPGNGGADEGEILTFSNLREQGMEAVAQYRREHTAKYIKLYKAEYGIEPDLKED